MFEVNLYVGNNKFEDFEIIYFLWNHFNSK